METYWFYKKTLLQNGMKYWKFYDRVFNNITRVFWVLLLFITMCIDWIIKRFSEVLEVAKTNDIYIFGKKHIVFVDKVIKKLSIVFMQQFNYSKFIWIKQNVSFACSNYQSNWQLTDNFCLHLSEPNRIETWRKRIVNGIVTTEPRCTVISVNRFTSICHVIKMVNFNLISLSLCPQLRRGWGGILVLALCIRSRTVRGKAG